MVNLPEFKGNTKGKRRLGKGLSSLLGNVNSDFISDSLGINSEKVINIPIEHIFPSSEQPRKVFCTSGIEDLLHSIKENGVIQPIIVKAVDTNVYKIIAGERRYRASKLLGIESLPCLVREFSELQSLVVSLTENLQRENLNPVEESEAYNVLSEEFDKTQEEISQLVGKSRSYIANIIRLHNLPLDVRALVSSGDLSLGHAKVLLSLQDPVLMTQFADLTVDKKLTVRDLEALTATFLMSHSFPSESQEESTGDDESTVSEKSFDNLRQRLGSSDENKAKSAEFEEIESKFNDRYSSMMLIKPSKKDVEKGVITIKYSSKNEFYEVLQSLNLKVD